MSLPAYIENQIDELPKWAVATKRIGSGEVAAWRDRIDHEPDAIERLKALTSVTDSYATYRPRKKPRPPAPRLHGDRDLPPVTASGIDPEILPGKVDWRAWRAICREPDRAKVFELIQRYSGPDGEINAYYDSAQGGPLYEDVTSFERERIVHEATSSADEDSGPVLPFG
jgi:hypothetical protein